ncbi:MAG: DUF1800 family protein [Sphingobacteriales bacterium]|nr:MAG: DUF1800 family protein [Sphingobacteriales bacterium]
MMAAADKLAMPYKKAGLTAEQAAAHLLSRFTYGAKPGQVQEVTKMGLDKWLKNQLEGDLNDKNFMILLREPVVLNS